VCSSGFQVVAPKDTYNLSYLYEFLKSPIAISQFELFMSGALYPAITNKDLKKILIPLPPLKIQNAIVENINEKKSQIKELKQLAETLRKEALEEFEKEVFE
ncbi:restriction endonuclease subunit S, partial [bacterium]|nr:restriction endonuclease subunit S [bacterium]